MSRASSYAVGRALSYAMSRALSYAVGRAPSYAVDRTPSYVVSSAHCISAHECTVPAIAPVLNDQHRPVNDKIT